MLAAMRKYLCWLFGHGKAISTIYGSKICEFCHKELLPSIWQAQIKEQLDEEHKFMTGNKWSDTIKANRGPRI